ncbi:MAG: FeS-binding protein, partial [Nonlabens sp.]|nr:FeS-binding protein [Nonlabens sp.]
MKIIRYIGLALFVIAMLIFTSLTFTGTFKLEEREMKEFFQEKGIKSEKLQDEIYYYFKQKEYGSPQAFSEKAVQVYTAVNEGHKKNKEYDMVLYMKPYDFAASLAKAAGNGPAQQSPWLMWWLTFGLAILGALLYIVPEVWLLGKPGIKNNNIYHRSITNRGILAWLVFTWLIAFYLVLYFRPDLAVNWTFLLDPISKTLNGGAANQWFVYGFLYCVVMMVMAVRMYIKYRHNKYQVLRTTSVLFFQIVFAFLIPEIMYSLSLPGYDFKNA